jgi:hypothetical protein
MTGCNESLVSVLEASCGCLFLNMCSRDGSLRGVVLVVVFGVTGGAMWRGTTGMTSRRLSSACPPWPCRLEKLLIVV